MGEIRPEQRIDLTGSGDQLRYVEVVTDGGTVRVNVNLVDTRTRTRAVVVEVEAAPDWDALTNSQGHGTRAEVQIVSRDRAPD
jgi:xanthine/CO dehydrogenase XdhC/CoxF family maturation factor